MQNSSKDLCLYRINSAVETLEMSKICIDTNHYKDSINRSYYAAFYAIKAVLALEKIDYDDFYMASKEEAEAQYQNAEYIINSAKKYFSKLKEQ